MIIDSHEEPKISFGYIKKDPIGSETFSTFNIKITAMTSITFFNVDPENLIDKIGKAFLHWKLAVLEAEGEADGSRTPKQA